MTHKLRRVLFSSTAVWTYLIANLAAFCAIAFWIFRDGTFAELVLQLKSQAKNPIELVSSSPLDRQLVDRLLTLKVIISLALASGLAFFLGTMLGPPQHRRLRSWLSLPVLIAIWLSLWASWPDLMWSGQAFRLKRQIDDLQPVVTSLHNDWPTGDGSRDEIGQFQAYPNEHPRVLQLLTPGNPPNHRVEFSQVERTDDRALRFKLTGKDLGAWLEWHPSDDIPRSFLGGLSERHDLDYFSPLSENWYLVRYK